MGNSAVAPIDDHEAGLVAAVGRVLGNKLLGQVVGKVGGAEVSMVFFIDDGHGLYSVLNWCCWGRRWNASLLILQCGGHA